MKRLKFYVSTILMVGFLGATAVSCVDDTESASVTELRSAKAGQLKAEATLADAQAKAAAVAAEALTIEANAKKIAAEAQVAYIAAETALKTAEVAHQTAMTAQQAAITADQVAKTAAAVAAAEHAKLVAAEELKDIKAKAAADAKQYDLDIKRLEAQLESLAIQSQIDLKNLQDQLAIANNTDAILADLIGQYSTLINNVNGLKNSVNLQTIELAKNKQLLTYSIIEREDAAKQYQAYLTADLASYTKALDLKTKELASWNALKPQADAIKADIASKKSELATLQQRFATAKNDEDAKSKVEAETYTAYWDFYNKLTDNVALGWVWQDGTWMPSTMASTRLTTLEELNVSIGIREYNVELKQKELNDSIASLAYLKSKHDSIYEKFHVYFRGIYDDAVKKHKLAVDAGITADIADALIVMRDAERDFDNSKFRYDAWLQRISNLESPWVYKSISYLSNDLQDYKNGTKKLQDLKVNFAENSNKLETLRVAMETAATNYSIATQLRADLGREINSLNSLISSLDVLMVKYVNANGDSQAISISTQQIADMVTSVETNITNLEALIKTAKADIEKSKINTEAAIAVLKENIARQETQLATDKSKLVVDEARANALKVKIDARR